MKKIISFLLAGVMCIFGVFTASAQETNLTFPMINTTGIIYLEGNAKIETNFEPEMDFDDSIVISTTDAIPNITSVRLEVEGKKYGRNYTSVDTFDFVNYDTLNSTYPNHQNTGDYWKLNIYRYSAPAGGFLVDNFDVIYSLKIVATGNFETDSEKVYYDWGTISKKTDDTPAFRIEKSFESDTMLAYAIEELITEVTTFEYYDKDVKYDYAFINNTDLDYNGIAERGEIQLLSYSELGIGKGMNGFEGLASQVSAFFNQKYNGKIIFKLTTAPAVLTKTWEEGGIPSTQVGIFNSAEKIDNDIVGLFFNYDSTGSLLARGVINKDSIEFDISEVLKAINGNTISTIRTIYYGLIGGIDYVGLGRGYKIESVILSYEDNDTVVETTIPTDTEEDEIIVEIEPEVTKTTTVSETTTEITTEPEVKLVEDTTAPVVVSDSNTPQSDTDENPRTGVALAVFPAAIAAVVGILSRKRR